MLQLCFARHNLTKIAQNHRIASQFNSMAERANKTLATHPAPAGETGAGSATRPELQSQPRTTLEPHIVRAGNGPPVASPRQSPAPARARMPPSIGGRSTIRLQTRSSPARLGTETAEGPSYAPTASPQTATEMREHTRDARKRKCHRRCARVPGILRGDYQGITTNFTSVYG